MKFILSNCKLNFIKFILSNCKLNFIKFILSNCKLNFLARKNIAAHFLGRQLIDGYTYLILLRN